MHSRITRGLNKGFTLTEIMVAIAIFSTVIAGASISFVMGLRAYQNAAAESDAERETSTTIARIAYGLGNSCGLRAAFKPVTILSSQSGWNITFSVPKGESGTDIQVNHIRYDKANKVIEYKPGDSQNWTTIGKHIIDSSIAASTDSVRITLTAQAVIGNNLAVNTKTSTIAFRN